MASHSNQTPELETAHILFMDIVGYSRQTLPEQLRLHEELQATLRATNEFRQAELKDDLICLPTGDGAALVFRRNPLAPVLCALEIAAALASGPQIQLRMGIHSGLVYRVRDINTNLNVSGDGINTAQRIMDCADAGHILLSRPVAEMLEQIGGWSGCITDLGECEVKHGARVRVFNLVRDGVGNPKAPDKLDSLRVAILYKRNAQPDTQVLNLLEGQLIENGYRVFIDRHLTVGVEWAKEIERQVRSSDAVIPLLSAASINSEMLGYEVQMAHEAAQNQKGKPRLLPIRINYSGPLDEPLAAILNPVQHTMWEGTKDDHRLVTELIYALQKPIEEVKAGNSERLEAVGGAERLDSKFWIIRPTENEFRSAMTRRDSIVLIKGARQMGKTSLLARGLQQAREGGAQCIRTDFQKLNAADLVSVETLFLALAEMIADQLDIEFDPDKHWNPRRGANVNFERFLRREVLAHLASPLVWAMDEVDRLFTCSFGSEVFGLFRSWHNERSLDPSGPWSRLTLAIAYATEAHLFITDMNQSPFNVGTRLTLEDFTLEQVADLVRRYDAPLRTNDEVMRFYQLLGGQPYLTRRGLQEMVAHNVSLASFEAAADRDEGMFGDHLRRFLVLLVRDNELCEAMKSLLRAQPDLNAESFYRLRSAGILAGDAASEARPRCQLYASYMTRHLL